MKNVQLVQRSVLHALGIMVYCALVVQIMNNGERLFGQVNEAFSGVAFLMLLSLSAAVVGTLIFGKPVLLYAEGKKHEAVLLVGYTLISLAVLTVILLVTLASL